jgi:hypothetical protein
LRRQSSTSRRNDGDTRIWKRSLCSSSDMAPCGSHRASGTNSGHSFARYPFLRR